MHPLSGYLPPELYRHYFVCPHILGNMCLLMHIYPFKSERWIDGCHQGDLSKVLVRNQAASAEKSQRNRNAFVGAKSNALRVAVLVKHCLRQSLRITAICATSATMMRYGHNYIPTSLIYSAIVVLVLANDT